MAIEMIHREELEIPRIPDKFEERYEMVNNLVRNLREKREEMKIIGAIEIGTPLWVGEKEFEQLELCFDYLLGPEKGGYVEGKPFGAMGSEKAYDLPFVTTARFDLTAFLAGNPVLLRYSSQNPETAKLMKKVLKDSYLKGIKIVEGLSGKKFVEYCLNHPRIRFLTIAGSGRRLVEYKGKILAAIEKGKLEKFIGFGSGGFTPGIVTEYADIDDPELMTSIFYNAVGNSGQYCVSTRLLLVPSKIYKKFIGNLKEMLEEKVYKEGKVGNPLDPDTFIGPVLNIEVLDASLKGIRKLKKREAKNVLEGYLRKMVAKFTNGFYDFKVWGGEIKDIRDVEGIEKYGFLDAIKDVHGKDIVEKAKFFYPAFVELGIDQDPPYFINGKFVDAFGPITFIKKVKDVEHAVKVACKSPCGLVARIYDGDEEMKEKFSKKLEENYAIVIWDGRKLLSEMPPDVFGSKKLYSGFIIERGYDGGIIKSESRAFIPAEEYVRRG